ncbi:unnamed protein product [Owenia fusiformis]|uniref:Uncharacterized protein n=1 Tax=Owenia fusiformis TaxID=6347 RepID=A0A8J1YAG1_OWEFU|nr:unnamed protein product [Owenia fusiformis]
MNLSHTSKFKLPVLVLLACLLYISMILPRVYMTGGNPKPIVPRKIQSTENKPGETSLDCGEICSYEVKVEEKRKYYPYIRKTVKCGSIMKRMALNPATPAVPPQKIPAELYDAFTQNGELPNKNYWYINDKKSISRVNREKYFSKEAIEQLIKNDKAGKIIGTYDVQEPKKSITAYKNEISNNRGVVIGSQSPWLEALALSAGAKHMTTLEYNNNPFLHPNITKIHPYDMAKIYANGSFQEFDFALSYSSIEHSGLGRYGDPLNPYGDLEAVAQVWCMLKPGGLFILGLPETHNETSYLQFNALRSYGHSRLKHLTANFEVIDRFIGYKRFYQGIWVLRKSQ